MIIKKKKIPVNLGLVYFYTVQISFKVEIK